MTDASPSILIAEDNRVMADVVRFNLTRAGYRVTIAHNGKAALESATSQKFDFVITDYQMPEMSGEDLCRELRNLDAYQSTPIVMCSAKGFELDKHTMRAKYGIERFLHKPFSPKELVQMISELLAAC